MTFGPDGLGENAGIVSAAGSDLGDLVARLDAGEGHDLGRFPVRVAFAIGRGS